MEITMRWHRLLRALAFLLGGLVFSVAIIFIFSNLSPIEVHWRIPATVGYTYDLTLPGVNTWLIALVPLLVGLVAGYLYQTPARMHHVRDALRHRHRVHELEHELREVRKSLDKLLAMPEDGSLAIAAEVFPALEHHLAEPVDEAEPELDPRLPDEPSAVEVLAAAPARKKVKPAEAAPAPPVEAQAARRRRRFFGGLRAEVAQVAEVKLPAAIPATIVARARRDDKAANGKSKPVADRTTGPVAKLAPEPARKSIRKVAAKKSN
ncbi:MAG TPA: hypothetical protein VIP52_11325 [Candidatus Dormibacteraeota bacterium]|jgi:uncharacterized membrane-anchored protein YhcB (DUF1043 family)